MRVRYGLSPIRALLIALLLLTATGLAADGLVKLPSNPAPCTDSRSEPVPPDVPPTPYNPTTRSVVNDLIRPASLLSTLDADTMPSPGIQIGITSWDMQHYASQGHQVATNPGSETVHFGWTMWDAYYGDPWDERYVNYCSWDKPSASSNQGSNGVSVSLGDFARGGFVRIDVDGSNLCQMTLYQRIDWDWPYSAWHLQFPIEGSALHLDRELLKPVLFPDEIQMLYPDIAVQQEGGLKDNSTDVYHIIAVGCTESGQIGCDISNRIWYYRYNRGDPLPAWEGPVVIDSSRQLSYVIDAHGDSNKVAVAFTSDYEADGFGGVNNVAYRESRTSGVGWLTGTELGDSYRHFATTFADPDGPQAWTEVSAAYDHDATLHLIFPVQTIAGQTRRTVLYHWSNVRGTLRRAAEAYYNDPGGWSRWLNLSQISLGVGDGATLCRGGVQSNEDYLYAVYTKLGGETPEEQDDRSTLGYSNGELYLAVSFDRGDNWSVPVNLTNTRTPDCTSQDPDATCGSEAWATVARDVSDIEILYIRDYEPGFFYYTGWTINKVMYLNLPGGTTDAEYLCPQLQSVLRAELSADPACEYHAPPGWISLENLTVWNRGNIPMWGDVSVDAGGDWLEVTGASSYTITEGDSLILPVTMSAVGLTEGLYVGNIRITHDDPSQPTPHTIPVAFFVSSTFYCPEDQILRTSVASPGVLSLEVGTDGRFGHPDPQGGLWRHADSSKSIFDASLLIAHGVQDPDTVVYHRFYERSDPGQYGFRPLEPLQVDTTAYGWGSGYALATANMTTRDSLLNVRASWFFPQSPDSADFVIVKYTVSNQSLSPINDIAVAIWADLNVVTGATWLELVQLDADNYGYYHAPLNLVYQYGYDDPWGYQSDYFETSERYSGGITYIAGRDYGGDGLPFALEEISLRGGVHDNRENTLPGGPSSGFMYDRIVGAPGVVIVEPPDYRDSSRNLYTYITLDQGLTLEPGAEQVYVIGLVSDTLEHYAYGPAPTKRFGASGLDDVVQRAWSWAEANTFCNCPCRSDPQCDGITNVLDVVTAVDVAFRGQTPTVDLGCPFPRTDVTCDRVTNVLDVVHFVNVAFRGGDPNVEFCEECP